LFGPLGWILALFDAGWRTVCALAVVLALYLSFMWQKELESRRKEKADAQPVTLAPARK